MKNTIFPVIAALFVTASVNAQSTVDSIRAKYQLQPMPEALTIEKTFPVIGSYQLNTADGSSQQVTITLDSTNRGMIWIAGLPEGTMKAFLKKSPGTYRIISQKAEDGKQIPEGTLFFDPSTNVLSVALGKAFDEADPTAIFASVNTDLNADGTMNNNETEVKTKTKTPTSKTKTKTKLVFYNATKNQMTTTDTNAATE